MQVDQIRAKLTKNHIGHELLLSAVQQAGAGPNALADVPKLPHQQAEKGRQATAPELLPLHLDELRKMNESHLCHICAFFSRERIRNQP